ncbi:hypothetical protein ICJ52_07835 [Streptomyces sp. KD18]|nr:hypothetical protein [Streptomyces sp. KD18]
MPACCRPPSRASNSFRFLIGLLLVSLATVGMVIGIAGPAWPVATIPEVITNLRNFIVGLLAGLATLFLTFGGLRYLMAGGDPSEVQSAKVALCAAAIGYRLAVLAPILVTALKGIVGA